MSNLRDLAGAAGLMVEWTDAHGKPHTVGDESLRAVLEALGFVCGNDRQIAESRAHLREHYGVEKSRHTQAFPLSRKSGGKKLGALAVQLYGLRESKAKAFGTFQAAGAFAERVAGKGIDAIALSPTHAGFSNRADRYSPYSPSSRLFLNPIFASAPDADGVSELIDWKISGPAALRSLRKQFDNRPDNATAFDKFILEGGTALRNHARFEAISSRLAKPMPEWPASYRNPFNPAVEIFAAQMREEIQFHLYAQFIAFKARADAQRRALNAGMRVGFITDVAVGVDPQGSDVWASPDDFLKGLTIGAPPDIFNPSGQNWNVTTFSPFALQRTRCAAFRDMLRANMRYAGGIRIDHAMGLCRLWVLPQGAEAKDGVYLSYPLDHLLDSVAQVSGSHEAIVIGEDLGTVPEGLRERLEQAGILGMQVLWFERGKEGGFTSPSTWSEHAVAMTTTHDLPTVAGWWSGRDLEWQERVGSQAGNAGKARAQREADRLTLWQAFRRENAVPERASMDAASKDDAVDAALAFVGRSASALSIIPIEDALGLAEQPNIPGTVEEHPNWRRLLPGDAETVADAIERRVALHMTARAS